MKFASVGDRVHHVLESAVRYREILPAVALCGTVFRITREILENENDLPRCRECCEKLAEMKWAEGNALLIESEELQEALNDRE